MKQNRILRQCFSLLIIITFTLSAKTFTIKPDTVVYVGEPVVFDAESLMTTDLFTSGTCTTFVWYFDDSSEVMKQSARYRSGLTIMHHFMKPDTYAVTLTVQDLSGRISNYTRIVIVKGVEPVNGFEVWHAPFHARTAQFIYVKIPQNITTDKANQLNVILQNLSKNTNDTLLKKTSLVNEEKCLLNHSKLSRGNYLLRVEIIDGSKKIITFLNERFSKNFDGDPIIGINEYNSLIKNGKPYFPISSWMLDPSRMADWKSGGFCNSVFMAGYLNEYTPATWNLYVNEYCKKNGFLAIGTEKFQGKAKELRNSRVSSMISYMEASGPENMLAYCWDDEPNLGGTTGQVNPNVHAAWSYATSEKDQLHPTVANLAGYFYLPRSQGFGSEFNFLYSEKNFGRKNLIADIYHGACFAMEGYKRIQYDDPKDSTRKAMDMYTEYLRNKSGWNYNLVPIMAVTATCGIVPGDTSFMPSVTVQQMRMQSWLNIVYGIKGMNWYQYWGVTYPENYGYMAEYYDQVTQLAPAILSAPDTTISITDDANTRGKRVDCLIRKFDKLYLVIAVRVTEMEYQDDPSFEQDTHLVKITLNGINLTGKKVFEYKNWTRVVDSFNVEQNKSTFRIRTSRKPYPGKVMIAGALSTDTTWSYLFDDGNGTIYKNRDWKNGGRYNCGTINYDSGIIDFTYVKEYGGANASPTDIRKGNSNIKVIYAEKEPEFRFLDLNGSSFTDKFGREDVHIYLIGDPSDYSPIKSGKNRTKGTMNNIINKHSFRTIINNPNDFQIFDCTGRLLFKNGNKLKPVSSGVILYKQLNSKAERILIMK